MSAVFHVHSVPRQDSSSLMDCDKGNNSNDATHLPQRVLAGLPLAGLGTEKRVTASEVLATLRAQRDLDVSPEKVVAQLDTLLKKGAVVAKRSGGELRYSLTPRPESICDDELRRIVESASAERIRRAELSRVEQVGVLGNAATSNGSTSDPNKAKQEERRRLRRERAVNNSIESETVTVVETISELRKNEDLFAAATHLRISSKLNSPQLLEIQAYQLPAGQQKIVQAWTSELSNLGWLVPPPGDSILILNSEPGGKTTRAYLPQLAVEEWLRRTTEPHIQTAANLFRQLTSSLDALVVAIDNAVELKLIDESLAQPVVTDLQSLQTFLCVSPSNREQASSQRLAKFGALPCHEIITALTAIDALRRERGLPLIATDEREVLENRNQEERLRCAKLIEQADSFLATLQNAQAARDAYLEKRVAYVDSCQPPNVSLRGRAAEMRKNRNAAIFGEFQAEYGRIPTLGWILKQMRSILGGRKSKSIEEIATQATNRWVESTLSQPLATMGDRFHAIIPQLDAFLATILAAPTTNPQRTQMTREFQEASRNFGQAAAAEVTNTAENAATFIDAVARLKTAIQNIQDYHR